MCLYCGKKGDTNWLLLKEVLNEIKSILNSEGILHLGAHRGKEAETYSWFNKPVLWIEANPMIFEDLTDNIRLYYKQEALNLLLGDQTKKVDLNFKSVDFDHPIWILFSSGTTGKPKAITHRTGGMILEHFKALSIHQNVYTSDSYFWYSTTGWMMWNYSLSSLLLGSSLCIYNGSPIFPDNGVLWRFAQKAKINHFGHGAVFFQNLLTL